MSPWSYRTHSNPLGQKQRFRWDQAQWTLHLRTWQLVYQCQCCRQSLYSDLDDLTGNCRPFYLPREFTAVIVTVVYISLNANANTAQGYLLHAINSNQTTHTDAVHIISWNFNHADLKTLLKACSAPETKPSIVQPEPSRVRKQSTKKLRTTSHTTTLAGYPASHKLQKQYSQDLWR